jgi:D-tagatose-1,6-bisphosphate aldolase subunit GatZ/KbaZ
MVYHRLYGMVHSMSYLDFIVTSQKSGQARGLPSVCSAHLVVLEAVLRHGLATAPERPVLIEATCNQVNQFGGYTGMRPADFVRFVHEIADRVGFPQQSIILGGDHLGPLVWSHEPAAQGMAKARELVVEYVRAGFAKIHLDCSTPCADDRNLPVEVVAHRTAELAAAAEQAAAESNLALRYSIGTEVPAAGGARAGEDHLVVTDPADAAGTIDLAQRAFSSRKVEAAWERVIALVVQPGVEFGDETIHEYDRPAASGLKQFIETVPGLVYEAHSTDYQTQEALRAMVEDHFAILKVGPGLTFAFRQAVIALAEMEKILLTGKPTSHLQNVLEQAMLTNPSHWQRHYAGSPEQQKFARLYSFSDRIRYYWTDPAVQKAVERLMANLGQRPLPLSLVSQYLPRQYEQIRIGRLPNRPRALLLGRVMDVLDDYRYASDG